MRRWRSSLYVPVLLVACFIGSAFAQTGGGRIYNPATETTIKGTVEKVTTTTGQRGMQGLHLTLKSDSPIREVHVGPAGYVSREGFKFAEGDQVEVTGSKVNLGGQDVMIAREIKKDGKTLTLRDNQGVPEWAGQGRSSY